MKYDSRYYIFHNIPSKILVNEEQINETNYWVDNLTGKENNITLIWNYTLTNCSSMFMHLENVTNIYFIKFDTSQVVTMDNMFKNCTSITKLDLSNFDTSSVKSMNHMFGYCSSLNKLNLSSFNTTSVLDMGFMFLYCSRLYYLDITNFDTSSVEYMRSMFLGSGFFINKFYKF